MTLAVIEKYGLGATLALSMTDPGEALKALHVLATDLATKVAEIEAASTTGDKGERQANALETKYGKDEAGIMAAEKFLRAPNGPFAMIVDYIGEDAGRTFHVKNAVADLLGKYLSNEVAYFVNEMTPKAAKSSRKGEYKADYNEVRELIAHVAGIVGPGTSEGIVTLDTAGKYKSTLAGFRGAKSTDDQTVTGRYAKVYALSWVIDGETVEGDWTIPEIVRYLWTGADRIGKNAKNLTDILDAKTAWTKPDFTSATFSVNGHKVTVARTVGE